MYFTYIPMKFSIFFDGEVGNSCQPPEGVVLEYEASSLLEIEVRLFPVYHASPSNGGNQGPEERRGFLEVT